VFGIRRREFVTVLGGAAATWPLAARALKLGAMPVIGFLSPAANSVTYFDGFRAGLQELGYVDGRTIKVEYRWAQGRFEQLPELAADLVHLNVDVLVASLTQAALVAKKATLTIPIVMAGVADPVAVGLIASLARPGGNITGTSGLAADIVGKQLELLKEVVPGVSRVAVLWNPANSTFQALQLGEVEVAARTAGLQLQLLEVRAPNEFEAAFADMVKEEGTRALAVLGDPLFSVYAAAIAELALKNRLATVSAGRVFTDAGIILSYGPSYFDLHKRAAVYVDKILKGAIPADLPVEQPTKFELVINLKSAKALGLEVPAALLARADEVIE
jgi:putative ABC transport system substrate-binding protein